MTAGRPITLAVDAVGGDFAPDAVLEGVATALAADPALRVLLVGPAEVVDAVRRRARPGRSGRRHRDHRHGRAPGRGRALQEGLLDRRRMPPRQGGKGGGFLLRGQHGSDHDRRHAAHRAHPGRRAARDRDRDPHGRPPVRAARRRRQRGRQARAPRAVRAHGRGVRPHDARRAGAARRACSTSARSRRRDRSSRRTRTRSWQPSVPGFVGNVEGCDIPAGTADVIVTDGFTGNVALKLMEGMSRQLLGEFKSAMLSSPVNKVAAAVLKPSLDALRDKLDPDSHGAAPLLGLDGLALIGHGSSSAKAVASALRVGAVGRARRPGGADRRRRSRLGMRRRARSCTMPRTIPATPCEVNDMPHATITSVGFLPARAPPHQRRPREDGRHHRRVDPLAHGIRERRLAAAGRVHLGPRGARGRPGARASGHRRPTRSTCSSSRPRART